LCEYAATTVLNRITVTGVQRKLSLGIEGTQRNRRFTIVGLWDRFILKPPSDEFPALPENEDAVLRLADHLRIPVVPHALIRLQSGEISFICKRIDRTDTREKLSMEDFCQISERLTEDKYRGSLERVGKLLRRYSAYPGLDVLDYFERTVFSFVVGNADMHLKNYSLIETPIGLRLSPAYDLLSTVLAIPDDPEQTALTLNGKKSNLAKADFDALAHACAIPSTARDSVYRKFRDFQTVFAELLNQTLLPESMRRRLVELFDARMSLFR
jgi:serine/threonine-protein kinase HipA